MAQVSQYSVECFGHVYNGGSSGSRFDCDPSRGVRFSASNQMNRDQLAELLVYLSLGEKVRCARIVKNAYGLSLEESKEWCGLNLFPILEDIRRYTDRKNSPRG